MNTKKKLFLISLILLGLLPIVLWFCGIRLGHMKLLFSEPMELSVEEKAEVYRWLQENTIALDTIEAGSGFDDMEPLKAMIGDARIVSLGEAAHLNRDFTRAKHRMVEFLVNEMGFTVFAIEATFAGALELNDYVLAGDGDPRRALGSLVYLAWNTEAFLDMVIWMREYNSTHEKKVKFYGFDNKPATGSAKAIYNYLKKTNGTKDYDKILSVMMNLWTANQLNSGPKEEMFRVMEEVKSLISYLENQKPLSEQGIVDQKEQSLAVQHAKLLLQHLEFYNAMPDVTIATDLRDKNMAQNSSWVMDHEDGAKMILWAANVHISAMFGSGCMGDYLRREYGDDMVVIGLLSNRKFSGSPDDPEKAHSARDGTMEATLAKTGLDIAVIDFHSLPKGIVSKYFNSPIREGAIETIYPLSYDAVLFIESTTTSRFSIEGALVDTERLLTPSNLDFEEIEDGLVKDWIIKGGQSRLEYQTAGSNDKPYKGQACGMIKKIPGRSFGAAYGNISQSIKAADFRGQKIRFTAAARIEKGTGYLWLSINKGPRENDIFQQEIITSDTWQEYHIEAEVPQRASKITYGLAYVGQSAAFIDEVSIGQSD